MTTQREKIAHLTQALGSVRGGILHIGDRSIQGLADHYGTPLFVYSGDLLEHHAQRIQAALGPDVDLYFSLKANPSLGVCQLLARLGIGAEVASGGELLLAEAAGFDLDHALFAGPGKTREELRLAVDRGLGAVNVESPGELERLRAITREHGTVARVGIRINPSLPLAGATMRMGGGSQQFGIPEEDAPALIRQYRDDPHIKIVGIHVYTGTQIFEADQLVQNARSILKMATTLSTELDTPMEFVDVGGGFGVPYFEGTSELDLEALGAGFRDLARELHSAGPPVPLGEGPIGARPRLIVELGRYLVASCGLYVTRVVDVKTVRGKDYLVTDGGMNHQTPATGNFGQVFRKPYPVAVLNRLDAEPNACASVVGPCCTPLDVLGADLQLAAAGLDDLIGIFYSGAYGYSASSLAFLSHPTPAEVLVYRGQPHLLREAGGMGQVLAGQQPIRVSD